MSQARAFGPTPGVTIPEPAPPHHNPPSTCPPNRLLRSSDAYEAVLTQAKANRVRFISQLINQLFTTRLSLKRCREFVSTVPAWRSGRRHARAGSPTIIR
jgi:hypothetical protein